MMTDRETIYQMCALLVAAGYEYGTPLEQLFDALVNMGNRETATAVRKQARTNGLPFHSKHYE